jgi:hypothetical protein
MLKKLQAMIDHPFAAPVTETVKSIGSIALFPLGGFIDGLKYAFDDDNYRGDETPRFLRMYGALLGETEGSCGITLGGMAVAGIAGAITAGMMASGAGGGVLGIIGWCAGAVAVGVAAGPFLMAGAIAGAAAVIGSVIGGVPGFIKGCSMVIDHFKHGKAQTQVAAALPPAQAQDEELTASLARALAVFNDLSKEQRATYVKMMNEQHMDESWQMNEKLLKAFDTLGPRDKAALVKGLKDRLSHEFTELAKREAYDSTVLQNEITVDGPLKLRKAPQAAA